MFAPRDTPAANRACKTVDKDQIKKRILQAPLMYQDRAESDEKKRTALLRPEKVAPAAKKEAA